MPHGLPGTGCHREGIPVDENRSPGDAAQDENRSHAEGISLHHLPQPDPQDAPAETYEGYRSIKALYLGGTAAGTGKDQEGQVGKR